MFESYFLLFSPPLAQVQVSNFMEQDSIVGLQAD